MSDRATKPVIAITVGDPAGVGPEIVVKAVASRPGAPGVPARHFCAICRFWSAPCRRPASGCPCAKRRAAGSRAGRRRIGGEPALFRCSGAGGRDIARGRRCGLRGDPSGDRVLPSWRGDGAGYRSDQQGELQGGRRAVPRSHGNAEGLDRRAVGSDPLRDRRSARVLCHPPPAVSRDRPGR